MSTWVDAISWAYVLAFTVFGVWFFIGVKEWWEFQKLREQLIKEARER